MTTTRWMFVCSLLTAAGCATTEASSAGAAAAAPARPATPEAIQAPATATPAVQFYAKGTQNYRCQAATSGAAEWKLVAPEADLFKGSDFSGPAGKHGAGPSWTLDDGSGAKGDAPNAKRAPSPESGSVPWLLIPTQSNAQPGALQGVTLVQRIETHGGAAPATGCDASSFGAETKVPYTAIYLFYR